MDKEKGVKYQTAITSMIDAIIEGGHLTEEQVESIKKVVEETMESNQFMKVIIKQREKIYSMRNWALDCPLKGISDEVEADSPWGAYNLIASWVVNCPALPDRYEELLRGTF
jgi:hypothetical protein